jgi:hypothetical protein
LVEALDLGAMSVRLCMSYESARVGSIGNAENPVEALVNALVNTYKRVVNEPGKEDTGGEGTDGSGRSASARTGLFRLPGAPTASPQRLGTTAQTTRSSHRCR